MANQQLTTTLADRAADLVDNAVARSMRTRQPVLISVSEEIEPVDPLRLFANAAAHTNERWYLEHPDRELAIAGTGVAANNTFQPQDRFAAANRMLQSLSSNIITDTPEDEPPGGPILFTGFGFDPKREADREVWKGFPPAYLCVPRVLLVRQGDRYTLTINLKVSTHHDAELVRKSLITVQKRTIDALTTPPVPGRGDRLWSSAGAHGGAPLPQTDTLADPPTGRGDRLWSPDDEPNAANYRQAVARGSQAVRDRQFEKVVLARYRDVHATDSFDIPAAIERLRSDYPGCYTFAVARKETTFLGASPEQLVRQDGNQVSAASLAGSIRRGATPDEDEQLGQQLLDSHKDQEEHEICARMIKDALRPYCTELNAPDSPGLLSFSNVHHLYTPVTGTLRNGSTLIQLAERLHPTPAVGGYPKDLAMAFIREHEGFDRGWYAAPIGWMDAEGNGEFIVALRSAVVSGQRARLFAGCGIVGESDPEQELAESNVKMRPMLAALGGNLS